MKLKLEIGRQYETRGGKRAVYIDCDNDGEHMFAIVDGCRSNIQWYDDGENGIYNGSVETDHDIIDEWKEPKTGVWWINIYNDGCDSMHDTKEEADSIVAHNPPHRIACKRVEWTEGDEE